jgi:fatty acid desaturase
MSPVLQPLRCAWPNLLVILYTFSGWALGIYLLTRPAPALNAAGVLLVTHTLIYSGYLIHECAHHAVFEGITANDRLGSLLSWLNGTCLANYQRLKKKHLRHHADRLDVVTFDYRAALTAAPAWVRRGVLVLEWAYVPAVELMMRGMVIGSPFQYGTTRERARVIVLLLIRLIFFTALALISI